MTNELNSRGLMSPNMGRPFELVDVSNSYKIGFFNKTIYKPLYNYDFESDGDKVIEEKIDDYYNLGFDRVFHFWLFDGGIGKKRIGPFYVPYIDKIENSEDNIKYTFKPLREVINPRLQKIEKNTFIMYFFSNFTTDDLPNNGKYTDDPQYLKRMNEFATNRPQDITNSSFSNNVHPPKDNTKNWYHNGEEITNPKCALCSCIIRIATYKVNIERPSDISSSSNNREKITIPICEKPTIVNWVGDLFATDYTPPALINRVQRIDWAENKKMSDFIENISSSSGIIKTQMNYYDIVNSIEGKMYPGYTGLNLKTRPIVDIYPDSLYHAFAIEDNNGEEKYFLEADLANIYSSPMNIVGMEWVYSGYPCQRNTPGLNVEDDVDENTPNAKTLSHYVIMRLLTSSSVSVSSSSASDQCDPESGGDPFLYLPDTHGSRPAFVRYNGECYKFDSVVSRSEQVENTCWENLECELPDITTCEDCEKPGIEYEECS